MSKIVELKAGEIENVVGGVSVLTSASLYTAPTYTAPTRTTTTTYQYPTTTMSMNPAPAPSSPIRRTY